MNDKIFALQVFSRVARSGSFSVAGREMGVSQPTASRIVAALEKDIGAALLTRTTRAVTLTEAGAGYLPQVEAILAAIEEADHSARGTGELRGVLRIATSPSFAIRSILPRLPAFSDLHPRLRFAFTMSDERQDLIGDAVDVAVRVGTLPDSSVIARKIGVVRRVLAASPAYLDKAGVPDTPLDLVRHRIIIGPSAQSAEGWTFTQDGAKATVRVGPNIVLSGGDGATAAAVAGLGILSAGELGMLRELQDGRLIEVLPDWRMGSADVHIILPAGRAAKPSARAFADFLATEFKGFGREGPF